jgi:hypothetical protein
MFLNDGRAELDTNTVGRAMRMVAGGRKNALLVLVQFKPGPARISWGSGICYAANAAFHMADAVLSLRRNERRSNWPLWIRRSSSTPAMVIAAVLNHLNPSSDRCEASRHDDLVRSDY